MRNSKLYCAVQGLRVNLAMGNQSNAFEKILTEEVNMKESINQFAQAGDPNAMIQLAEMYFSQSKVDEAKKFFRQAAEKNYRPAARRLAEIFRDEENFSEAIVFYKQAVESGDVKAMDALIDLCPNDEEILNFVLEIIDKHYNEIYTGHSGALPFDSIRMSEYLPAQDKAIERRRIKNKILKLKAKEI